MVSRWRKATRCRPRFLPPCWLCRTVGLNVKYVFLDIGDIVSTLVCLQFRCLLSLTLFAQTFSQRPVSSKKLSPTIPYERDDPPAPSCCHDLLSQDVQNIFSRSTPRPSCHRQNISTTDFHRGGIVTRLGSILRWSVRQRHMRCTVWKFVLCKCVSKAMFPQCAASRASGTQRQAASVHST